MTPEPDTCVIVPTIRDYDAMRAYFENAREHDFDLERIFVVLVTEDFCDTTGMRAMLDEEGVSGAIFDGSARQRWFDERGLAEYAHLVPEASHAQTSFGLLYLWANETFDYGVFIDDDTRPLPDVDFFGTHLRNLDYEGPLPAVESDENWVNVLHQGDTDLYPRGYPYSAMGEDREKTETYVDDVVASQGLWTNVPDLDAVRILMDGDLDGQAQTRMDPTDFEEDFVAADGNYLTVCSMNLAFRREIVPAFYQLPMDDNEWGIARFDDIWSGVFLKRACEELGTEIYNGDPLCRHDKAARSTFQDLQTEVAGLELNEHLWQVVDNVDVDAESFAGVYRAIADELIAGDYSDWNNGAFLNYCGRYMHDWLECLDEIEERRGTVQPVMADD